MNDKANEATLSAMLKMFQDKHYPRAIRIKERLENGEVLTDHDLRFLKDVLQSAKHAIPFVQKNEKYQKLTGQITSLYSDIVELAARNEPDPPVS